MPRTTVLIADTRLDPEPGQGPKRLSTMRTRTPSRTRSLVVTGLVVVALVALVVLVVAGFTAMRLSDAISFPASAATDQLRLQLTAGSAATNILVDVTDTSSSPSAARTTALVLVHIDGAGHRVWRLWIPPSLVTLVAGHGSVAFSEIRGLGGEAALVQTVKRVTGLPVSQLVEFKAPGIAAAVDKLGGAWVDVPSGLTSPSAEGSGSAPLGLMAGSQMLTGPQAAKLAFATTPADTVYAPVRNQELLLQAVAPSLRSSSAWALGLISAISPYTKTTMGLGTFYDAVRSMQSAGSSEVFDAVLLPNKDAKPAPDLVTTARLAASIRHEQPFGVAGTSPKQAAANAASVAPSKPATRISVTVRNGSGLSGAAKQAAGLLQTQGFVIKSTGNANLNVYPRTLVIYKNDVGLATYVAQYLPPGTKLVRSYGLYQFDSDILIVIGKDWDLSKAPVVPIQAQ